ncbi:uncharacterized protein si:ch73-181m17.1 isoform X2 [Triplophysa rosa]|uniref:uncharacterized protein si:ch73-181m17.1 isoform X2 n=1 Tax=Triplophysa rosa TaxID=992332 RepID=UPI0025460413|nr:uncharacterized protein si:ch73-181m17.1 isoform X2 [Triplophysa rosa]
MRFLTSLCVPLLLLVNGAITNGQTTVPFSSPDIDPCDIYTSLDEPWRAINFSNNNFAACDYNVNWDGWYRLFYNGEKAQMPESCVSSGMCGSYNPLWLSGGHPQLDDGVVIRQVCSPTWNDCCGYKSHSIQVKACPGNYYVYQFVSPSHCATYCADVEGLKTTSVPITTVTNPLKKSITVPGISVKTAILPFDPCNTYTVLDEPWRATSNKFAANLMCDASVSWSGWYRLFIRGHSVQMPDTCVDDLSCGTHAPLWLNGPHPRIEDGVVTRDVCGNWFNNCCFFRSNSIQVKACPGNYYVYEFTRPSFCYGTYCADDRNMTIPTVSPKTTLSGAVLADPCYSYTVLDELWRAIDQYSQLMCDSYVNWSGWYRLSLHGQSAQMPDTCVSMYSCSTHAPLWLNGQHPRVEDGVVTRHVCGHWNNDCCHFQFYPMKVKACPGNYYVYEFVSPTFCFATYCAVSDPRSNNMSYISVTPMTVRTTPIFDPCSNYNVLDDFWRSISRYLHNGQNDLLVEWNGWYRLFLNGQSAQMSEWCVTHTGCGGDTGLYLNGSHPRLGDGVVTREVSGTYMWQPSLCGTYRSNPIQIKACPGHYYVYNLVKPDMSIPRPTYCAVAFKSISNDPCYDYTSLDRPWRTTNESGLTICDNSFSYNGWYRLFHNGMNIRMSENCVGQYSCNTQVGLWLNGPHPRIEDGVVTREVCGDEGNGCCSFKSTPIRVKACPGNYYIYEIAKTLHFCSAYCTDANTISQMVSSTPPGAITASLSTIDYDPCYNYNILDNYWRSALNNWHVYGQISGNDDTVVEWDGWYRLLLNGSGAQMPEWCANYMSCGGFSSLWLGGPHPKIQDGVVTRDVYGTQNDQCSYYRSNPIQVKACPGNYYVYKFVKPRLSIPMPVYCAVPFNTLNVDPCYNYSSLDDLWRVVNSSNLNYYSSCDYNVDWNGWYRLFYNGQSAKMPNSCVRESTCGSQNALWLSGSHPQLEDGVVTRKVCSPTWNDCCGYKSLPIQVKACPGNYYVYQFVRPLYCAAYCSEHPNFHTPSPPTVTISPPKSISVSITAPVTRSSDPCFNYAVLDEPWRATSNRISGNLNVMCDAHVSWSGWYRLFIHGQSVQMPTTCVGMLSCGTHAPLWLDGQNPRVEDGVVTRNVCGHWQSNCCYFQSNPIKVKACPGNYYVYEFTRPNYCYGTYCADVSTINATYSTIMPTVMPTAVTSISDPCSDYNIVDDFWRDIHRTQFSNNGYDDRFVEWNGWYRLFLNGQNARMSEGCTSYTGCGGDTGLYLSGSHPRLEDGVVTREVLGTIIWYPNLCDYYRSNPIQIKACPGDYHVYKLVKPDMSISRPTYCAVTFNNISNDPCHNFESLDRPWRASNESGLTICDDSFTWNGWYRLFYNGMNIRISEKCVNRTYSCNAYYSLWLNGPHPQIEDGVVTREVCVSSHRGCCAQKFTPIRVKACPGNYYVYELAQPPQYYCTGYCTDINTISQTVSSTTPTLMTGSVITSSAASAVDHDPCYNYNILENYWRSTHIYFYGNGYGSGHDDTRVEWDGWYRLYLNRQSAQIPEWCAGYMACGGFSSLWLDGSHPQPKDGIVTREVYGTQYGQCSNYRSNPIQVKACPGIYYVYKLIRPKLSIPVPSYCAVAFTSPSVDPCISYTSLEEPWRSTNYASNDSSARCDYNVNWNGWYRLSYNGQNAQMPESCVGYRMCGTYSPLWLIGRHPQLADGVVVRQVCGSSSFSCCSYNSHPIQVKACPGNYYVYEFIKPALCSAYCAEAQSFNQTTASPSEITPSTGPTVVRDPCSDLNCTENEWCGEHNGVYGCFCNQTQPTSNPDTFDAYETCESSSGFMSLSRCQLFEAGFSADVLHLNDPSCRGTVQNERVEFRFDNNGSICGTGLVANGTHIIYENFIFGQQGSAGGVISRKKFLKLRFNCVYHQTHSVSMDINPLESIVHRNIQGLGTYRVRMLSYQDAQFSKPFTGSVSVEVDQKIFVEVRVDGVDGHRFASVIDTCWATPANDPQSSLLWDLIVDECPNPNDNTVELLQNGVSTSSRFSFRMFIFTAYSTKVYLHCKIHLCLLTNNTCSSQCQSGQHLRVGRSLDFHDTASISMGPLVWSKETQIFWPQNQ